MPGPLMKTRAGKAFGALFILGMVAVFIIIGFLFLKGPSSVGTTTCTTPVKLNYRSYTEAAVSCDSPYCAVTAKKILEKGGSVADAAIAGLLTMGVVHAQSLGIGGGFFMMLYNATTKTARMLNARETAPAFATESMFGGNSTKSQIGGLAVAVPGEIRGYGELWKDYGVLPWAELFKPAIRLARNGFKVSTHTASSILNEWAVIKNSPSMYEILRNPNASRDRGYIEGENMSRPKLADTLELIAKNGADEFYEGNVAKWFVEDLQGFGGNITLADLKNYEAKWVEPLKIPVHGNLTLYAIPPPGSGLLLGFILKVLSSYGFNSASIASSTETLKTYQRIIEAFKHAFAYRTKLGDPFDTTITEIVNELVQNLTSDSFVDQIRKKIDLNADKTRNDYQFYGAEFYNKEDAGTAHISIVSSNGDAISVTSTINTYFGARIRSRQTDIIYNNEMDDFSAPNVINYFGVPPSPNNFIKPGKRPMSSMTPAIFVDREGKCRLVVGAAGGTKIITSTALTCIRSLWFQQPLVNAVDDPRFHHQLYPMQLDTETDFDKSIAKALSQTYAHVLQQSSIRSAVTAVSIENGTIYAKADRRKDGSVAGISHDNNV